MNIGKTQRLAWTLTLALTASSVATAQQEGTTAMPAVGLTRHEVVADLLANRATHRWDDPNSQWVLREPAASAESGLTRSEVLAERAAFIRLNRWDEPKGGWILRTTPPRDPDASTRAQVAASTEVFVKAHTWDEATQLWNVNGLVRRMQ